jgi:hypothetical protein
MASSSGAVVEYSPHHLKVKDSSLAAAVGSGREKKMCYSGLIVN